jgi:hypothetical protein
MRPEFQSDDTDQDMEGKVVRRDAGTAGPLVEEETYDKLAPKKRMLFVGLAA